MMTAKLLNAATTSRPAADAATSTVAANGQHAATDVGVGHDDHAPARFSALMRGMSGRFSALTEQARGEADGAAVDTDATTATAGKDAAPASDSSSPDNANRTDADLPGMAMPLLPVAVDLSLNAAHAAAQAASDVSTLQTSPTGLANAAAPVAVTAAVTSASSWPSFVTPRADSVAKTASGSGKAGAIGIGSGGIDRPTLDGTAGRVAAPAARADRAASATSALPGIDAPSPQGEANADTDGGAAPRASGALAATANALPDASALQSPSATLPAVTLKLPGDAPAQWRQPLAEALGDRLQVQMNRNVEQAVIRLDPPNLGRIDISISHDAGSLQVHLSASNTDVLRQLHTMGDNLRQGLSHGHYNDVAVTVSDTQTRGGDPRQRGRQPADEDRDTTPGKALAEAESGQAATAFNTFRTS